MVREGSRSTNWSEIEGGGEFEIWAKLGPWAVLVPSLLGGVSMFAGSGAPDPLAVESDMT